MTSAVHAHDIVPRRGLDFRLDDDLPRHWLAGDPFRSRFFDALSVVFPAGERYFIDSARDWRERVESPELRQRIADFLVQEGQHSKAHRDFNRRLEAQGIPAHEESRDHARRMADRRERFSETHNLAITVAIEHLTAMLAYQFLADPRTLEDGHPSVRALFLWHCVEEIEHKSVAFDVYREVARGGYLRRVLALVHMTWDINRIGFGIADRFLRADGFGLRERLGLHLRGFWWLYGPRGMFTRGLGYYFAYFRPGFHPDRTTPRDPGALDRWLRAYADAGEDPVLATDAFVAG